MAGGEGAAFTTQPRPLALAIDTLASVVGCRSRRGLLAWLLFLGAYVATLAFFDIVDVYNEHFFETGYTLPYNAFRVLFAGYLFWLIYVVGCWTFRSAGLRGLEWLALHERVALGFFVGAAVLTVLLLVLGYLSLYWRAVAAAITLPIVAASWRLLNETVQLAKSAIERRVRGSSRLELAATVLFAGAAIYLAALLLLLKGLYPQGGHDFFLHYSQFYSAVIDNHGIWPNHFWYHYYVSKGMGLMFLGIVLTDALAPSLVSFCFYCAAALCLFSLVRRFCRNTAWPWLAVALYFGLSVQTNGTGAYFDNGGWGYFQKPHEINSAFILAILWMSVNMVRDDDNLRRLWLFGALVCSLVVPFVMITSAGQIGLFALLAALAFLAVRHPAARSFGAVFLASGIGLALLLVINYVTTGIPADVAGPLWWPIVDLRRLADDGTLYDFGWNALVRARASADGTLLPKGLDIPEFLANLLRLEILAPLIVYSATGILVAVIGAAILKSRRPGSIVGVAATDMAAGGVILIFGLTIGLFTIAAGLSEAISYVRLTSFILPFVIALAAIAWQIAIAAVKWPKLLRFLLATILPVVLTWLPLQRHKAAWHYRHSITTENALRFVSGNYSIYDAARDQRGWTGLPHLTSIHPAVLAAWTSVGPGKRIWSFHVHSYCMLPGCRLESLYSSSMTTHRSEVYFGSPAVARDILRREGLNYFFISPLLSGRDVLQCAPLFAADTLADHFDFQWTDGTEALLTWKGDGTAPLTAQWVATYREATKPNDFTGPCEPAKPYFMEWGRQLAEAVAKGKRWGLEVPLPK